MVGDTKPEAVQSQIPRNDARQHLLSFHILMITLTPNTSVALQSKYQAHHLHHHPPTPTIMTEHSSSPALTTIKSSPHSGSDMVAKSKPPPKIQAANTCAIVITSAPAPTYGQKVGNKRFTDHQLRPTHGGRPDVNHMPVGGSIKEQNLVGCRAVQLVSIDTSFV